MRRTKIVCTIGPATAERVTELIQAGMDVARLNFSHGTEEEQLAIAEAVRRSAETAGRPVGLFADLSGPKVRIGELEGDETMLQPGARFVLTYGIGRGDERRADTDHPGLAADLTPGDRVMLADGAVELSVEETNDEVATRVISGGLIRSRAGVNVPARKLALPAVTEKDRKDLARILDLEADFVAQSFVRGAEDLRELRRLAGREIFLLAKIETGPAVEDIDSIIEEADGIMLARGDLGVELPFERIPTVQKETLQKAGRAGVPSIVATQMLESMVTSPRPTRAEVSDVANAVLDGADAILLSAETAIGHYPVEAVSAAARTLEVAEAHSQVQVQERRLRLPGSKAQAVAVAAAYLTQRDASLTAIACYTETGHTAELLSEVRPGVPVFSFSPYQKVLRRLSIRRALVPLPIQEQQNTDALIAAMDSELRGRGLFDQTVLMVAATPVGEARTNFLKVHQITG